MSCACITFCSPGPVAVPMETTPMWHMPQNVSLTPRPSSDNTRSPPPYAESGTPCMSLLLGQFAAATIRLNLRDDLAAESLPSHFGATSKHTRQLLEGNPCLHCCSTKPSWPQTNLPSNLRNRHCNRTAWKTSHSHRLGPHNPYRGLCSTTPSFPLTNLLANLRNHRRNCTDRAVEGVSAAARRGGGFGSTSPSYRGPKCSTHQLRS